MIKFLAIIISLSALSAGVLELPRQAQALEDASSDPQARQLIDPALATLTVAALSFLVGFITGYLSWRHSRVYQETLFRMRADSSGTAIANRLQHFHLGVYTKEVVNRCLVTMHAVTAFEDLPHVPYFDELCMAWGRFIQSHAHLTIKFFDVTYALQYFDIFLTRELVTKTYEPEPESVRHRNRRFVTILQTEMEGNHQGRDPRFSQTSALRVTSSFYGGFWEVLFHGMLDETLQPKRADLLRPSQIRPNACDHELGFWCLFH